MNSAASFTTYSSGEYPRLVLQNGDIDLDAIAREIARRCGEGPAATIERRRLFWERHVLSEAAYQQWPFVQALIPGEWSEAERAEYDRLIRVTFLRDAPEDDKRRERAEAIRQGVVQRAIAKFNQSIMEAAQ